MFSRLVDFVLTQRLFIWILTVALALLGFRALVNLPIEAFPDVQDVQVQIVTQYPGQAPEEVERAVTLPIERELSGVPHQTQLRSVSITGLSVVTLTFSDGTDDYFARQQVLEKLQNVVLPTGIQPGLAPLTTAVGEIFRYVIDVPAGKQQNDVRALQDWVVRPALRIVPGVADVVSFGGTIKEYQIRVDPNRLKRYGVTIDQVSAAVANNGANVGGGLLRRGDEALVIRSQGIFTSTDDIGSAIVLAKNGRAVQVTDVAEVIAGSREPSGIVAFNGADTVVEGIVQMTKGSNAATVIADVRLAVDAINRKLPGGARLKVIYDRTALIDHTVHTVAENLLIGAGLVIGILMIFLGNWRAAVIVAMVIPLSLLGAFIMLDLRGIPANLISLGAVDFGIIIDSAVVMVEALMVRLALQAIENAAPITYADRKKTLRDTVVGLGHPIMFSKAIIIVAFIPIYTFQRVEGKIFSPVAFTLSFAILGALVLTMTLVPACLAWTIKRYPLAERNHQWMLDLQQWYRRVLIRAQQKKKVVILTSASVLIATGLAAPLLGSEFLPKLDEGNIWLTITLPPSTALEKTRQIEQRVRAILRGYSEVGNVIAQVGRPDDGTDPKGPNNIEILADLTPIGTWRFHDKDALIEDISSKIRSIPGVPTNFSQVIEDNVEEALSGVKGEIAVKIFGPDLAVLSQKSDEVAAVLRGIEGAADVASVKIGGQTEVDVKIDRAKIARLGINIADVNAAIQTAMAGATVNTFFEGDRRFDITVRLQSPFRQSADQLAALQINLPSGAGTVALGDLSRIEIRQGAARISREAGGRNASVKANLLGRDQGSFVAEAQGKVATRVHLPPGYEITWGGQFENQQRAIKRLQIIIPITALLIFSLLFLAFRSVRRALLVLSIVPCTLVGGVIGLAAFGLHFSVSAAVGFIAVAGISVQNGVIMVEQIVELTGSGIDVASAAIEGAVSRLRPILMTALMAGLGLLPAALSHGAGSETQRPFAVVIIGGIISATIFTLLLVPLAFVHFTEKRELD